MIKRNGTEHFNNVTVLPGDEGGCKAVPEADSFSFLCVCVWVGGSMGTSHRGGGFPFPKSTTKGAFF